MPNYHLKKGNKRVVVSLGGSLINPGDISVGFLKSLRKYIAKKVVEGWKFVIITGGGAPARCYIKASSMIMDRSITKDDMDWLGIHATRFNAHLVRTIFREISQPNIITDVENDYLNLSVPIIVGGGWKPGRSTDFVSVRVANRVNASYVVNLSNIKQVFSDDPKANPQAIPLEYIKWGDYCQIVGDEWNPGLNTPFDPIASKLARDTNVTVLVVDGCDFDNLDRIFTEETFVGTVISN